MTRNESQNIFEGCYKIDMGTYDIFAEDEGCGIFSIYEVSNLGNRYFAGKVKINQEFSKKQKIQAIKEKYTLMQ